MGPFLCYHQGMIKKFFLTLFVFLGIDLVWLGLIAKNFYAKQLEPFSRTSNLAVAFLSYILIVLGLAVFVLPKSSGNVAHAFLYGALFGLITYGVYDLVNLATLADWSLKMTVVDMLWGGFVCGLVSTIVSYLLRFLR